MPKTTFTITDPNGKAHKLASTTKGNDYYTDVQIVPVNA